MFEVHNDVDLAFALLLKNAVAGSDQPGARLEQVNLLKRAVRLEESVLAKDVERHA